MGRSVGKGQQNVGKRARVWDAGAWFRGTLALGFVLSGACGARNTLPGGLAIDDDTSGSGGGGQNAIGGPASAVVTGGFSTVATGAANSSFASGFGGSGVSTTGITPSTGFSGVTSGVGAAPSCPTDSTSGGGGMDSAAGAAGAAGEGGVPSEPTECPIPYCSGWVNKDGNCANIQGTFFTYSDQMNGGSSTITATSETDRFCVSGQVNRVVDGQYDVYWGAGFGLTLNQPGFNYPAEAYDAEQEDVVGFGFSVDSLPIGELRFMVRAVNEDIYCQTVFTQGYSEFRLADLIKGCWDPMSTPHDYSSLRSIEWHFVSNGSTPYTFALCLTDLTVYRDPTQ